MNEIEKERMSVAIKHLEIEPTNDASFSSGWWLFTNHEDKISLDLNDTIKIYETKEYKYTVDLDSARASDMDNFFITFYIYSTFSTGDLPRIDVNIPIGNLDYQAKITAEKKANSNSGKICSQASSALSKFSNAMQFRNGYFSPAQENQISDFFNLWLSELVLAQNIDKTDFKGKVSDKVLKKISEEWLKKLGLSSSVMTVIGDTRATTYLVTQTVDGKDVFIRFYVESFNFDFGSTGTNNMAYCSGSAYVYDMDGNELDSSVILATYADISAFCTQLQNVASDTIFGGIKTALGVFDVSADKTADQLSSTVLTKIMNNKYDGRYLKMSDWYEAVNVKSALKKVISKTETTVNKKIYKLLTTPSKQKTKVSIDCPVDVYIYDNDGNLCGSVKNNIVDVTYTDIFITVVDDRKNIYFDGDDYCIKMIGNDIGTMDYIVTEFNEDGSTSREITYENIELSNGKEYCSYVPETLNFDRILFDVSDSNKNAIYPLAQVGEEFDFEDCKYEIKSVDNETVSLIECSVYKSGEFNIPESVTYNGKTYSVNSIGYSAFYNCTNLTNITIPDSVTSIGAFQFCTNLKSISIPDSITSIEKKAFRDCTALTSISIPDSVVSIGEFAFYNCSGLTKINIPDNVESIGEGAFRSTNIETINIPNSVISIGDNAFALCEKLKSVYMQDSVKKIGSDVFYNCTELEYVKLSNNIESLDGDTLWDIEHNGGVSAGFFAGCSNLKSINIPENIKIIGYSAFSGCEELENIDIPYGLTNIGSFAFAGCSKLNNINIPDSTKKIGGHAFYKCDSLESIIMGKGLEEIGVYAFQSSNNIKNVYIKDITAWCNIEFENMQSCPFYYSNLYVNDEIITKLIIPDNVDTISNYAFCGLNIEEVIISNTTSNIGDYSFYDCPSLIGISIPNSVTSIGNGAFKVCKNLTNISIPDSITSIGYEVFFGCSSLKSIAIPGLVTSIGNDAFRGCSNLKSITIPDSVTSIGEFAFYGCPNLESIYINNAKCEIYDDYNTISVDTTIYGHNNSTAQAYAEKYDRTFVDLENMPETTKPVTTTTTASETVVTSDKTSTTLSETNTSTTTTIVTETVPNTTIPDTTSVSAATTDETIVPETTVAANTEITTTLPTTETTTILEITTALPATETTTILETTTALPATETTTIPETTTTLPTTETTAVPETTTTLSTTETTSVSETTTTVPTTETTIAPTTETATNTTTTLPQTGNNEADNIIIVVSAIMFMLMGVFVMGKSKTVHTIKTEKNNK